MKAYVIEYFKEASPDVVLTKLKIKAADEDRAMRVAERLKKEGKISLDKNIKFRIKNPRD